MNETLKIHSYFSVVFFRYGRLSLAEFPELLADSTRKSRSRSHPLSEEAKFDAEIDRLCNLGALHHIAKKAEKKKALALANQVNSHGRDIKQVSFQSDYFYKDQPQIIKQPVKLANHNFFKQRNLNLNNRLRIKQ